MPHAKEFQKGQDGQPLRRDDPAWCGDKGPDDPPCEVCPKAEAGLKDQDMTEANQDTVEHYWRIQALGASEEDRADPWVRRYAPAIHKAIREAERQKAAAEQSEATAHLIQVTMGAAFGGRRT